MADCWECENKNTQMCEGCKYGYMDGIDGWIQFDEPTHFIPKEPQESEKAETWNGIHAQITAPKGTFERIFNNADDEDDI